MVVSWHGCSHCSPVDDIPFDKRYCRIRCISILLDAHRATARSKMGCESYGLTWQKCGPHFYGEYRRKLCVLFFWPKYCSLNSAAPGKTIMQLCTCKLVWGDYAVRRQIHVTPITQKLSAQQRCTLRPTPWINAIRYQFFISPKPHYRYPLDKHERVNNPQNVALASL